VDVTVAVATFGDDSWGRLARERAIPSAEAEGVPFVHAHGDTLAGARNAALAKVATEFVIHLDADDELEPGYVEAMARGTADVRAPVVRYVRNGRARSLWQPRVAGHTHDCEAACLRAGNWIVIGACAGTELLRSVGWHDFDWSEDWATWALLAKAGASFELVRDAVYRAESRPMSRNRGADRTTRLEAHRVIEQFVWPEECAA
jgi:glycosyltransferase involved in cell wall biosynthesis